MSAAVSLGGLPWRVSPRVEPGDTFAVILPKPQSDKDPLVDAIKSFHKECQDVTWQSADPELPGALIGLYKGESTMLPTQRLPNYPVRCWVRP